MSDEKSTVQQRYLNENFPRLKPIDENSNADEQKLQQQVKHRSSYFLPPIKQSTAPSLTMSNSSADGLGSEITHRSTMYDIVKRVMLRQDSSASTGSSKTLLAGFRPKRISLFDHIHSRIDTGLSRPEIIVKKDMDTYQLTPTRQIKWSLLKQSIERDLAICKLTQQMQFNSGQRYSILLNAVVHSVKSKVKQFLASTSSSDDERYKIVVNVTVFPKTATGLCIDARCLWNTATDNSITVQMKGVDCNILIVAYVFYTDLGAILHH
ncbi:unnamed protein product [Rotaria magnacalcarata]|uniref:Uncharacterized protein n=1 Tax=Rotaria magnacalcarata TaxID=392030 RepID=A0A815UI65_9BILA|nr:unnamed protein product [Rotaria magnacalcarata]CAF1514257.1 unnamed protein product [Rotaria magnacalcarata]CAF3826293.1 unnamed protein product [Rotaria magnacalcarata]CAF3911423.1 unnamed protein product [Rotaria magnacalcarata]